jgi:hypothetical protein
MAGVDGNLMREAVFSLHFYPSAVFKLSRGGTQLLAPPEEYHIQLLSSSLLVFLLRDNLTTEVPCIFFSENILSCIFCVQARRAVAGTRRRPSPPVDPTPSSTTCRRRRPRRRRAAPTRIKTWRPSPTPTRHWPGPGRGRGSETCSPASELLPQQKLSLPFLVQFSLYLSTVLLAVLPQHRTHIAVHLL